MISKILFPVMYQILFTVMIHPMPLLLHVIDSLKLVSECSSGVFEGVTQVPSLCLASCLAVMSTKQKKKIIL